jgi:hypothetical protein
MPRALETQGDLAAVHAAALLDWTRKHRLARERWQTATLSDRVDYMRDAAKRLGFAI